MNEYVQFIKRIGIVGIANILISLSGLIFIPIITKNFSTAEYGIWAQVNTLIALVPNIVNLGLPYTMVRFLASERDKSKIRESFYSMMLVVLLSTIIMILAFIIFSHQIAGALFEGNMQIMYIVTIISFLACINLMFLSYFRTFQRIKHYSLFLVLQTYIGVGVSILLTALNQPIEMVVLGLLTGYLAVFLIMGSLIVKYLGLNFKIKKLTEELKFAIPTVPSNVSSWVVDSSDKFVIGIILSASAVGCYSPGYALGSILLMFLSPFAILLPAVLPQYYDSGNMQKVDTFLRYSLKYYLVFTIPAAVGISILSKPLLLVLTTDVIAAQGYLVTPAVALGALFMGVYGITNNILILEKKTNILGHLWTGVAILNIILNIIMVPYLGIFGASIATLICYIMAFAVTVYHSRKYAKLPFDYKAIAKIIVASAIMGIFVEIAHPTGLVNIIIVVVIAVVIYFAALFLIKGINKKEINLFKEML